MLDPMSMAAVEWLMSPQAAELEELVRRPAWQARAACRGTSLDVFFPEKKGDYAQAKAMCAECPVCQECLVAAIADPGIAGCWGGTSRRERARLPRPQESERPARLLTAVASPKKSW
jgi:WhiB family transcriptional regulator, redox-sensing transcriptional regulator